MLSAPQPGWDVSGGSAVPSDENLDALLAHGEEADREDLIFEAPVPQVTQRQLGSSVDPVSFDEALLSDQAEVLAQTPEAEGAVERSMQPPRADSDLLRTIPGLEESDIDFLLQNSTAVTRELDHDPLVFSQPETQVEAEVHAQETLVTDLAADPADPVEVFEPLRPRTELFHRARRVKDDLVSDGIISGMRELEEEITTSELIIRQDSIATRQLPSAESEQNQPYEMTLSDDDADYDALLPINSVTHDTAMLRAALEMTPEDDELHWWLAEALRERGDMADAYREYRWLIHQAPSRYDDILHALNVCVERDQEPETAHRLLGDIYRRRGDIARASSHATAALQARRRVSRVQVQVG